MTEHAICFRCIEDAVLHAKVESDGEPLRCESCGEENNNAFSYARLGEELEPIVREHFEIGPMVRQFYDDDREGWEQEGDPLVYIVQMVLGQDVVDPDALVKSVMDAEDYWPGDGDEAFYDYTQLYVPCIVRPHAWMAEWEYLGEELAHHRRFFSESARGLFDRLFAGVSDLNFYDSDAERRLPVVDDLPAGTEILRARVVRSDSDLRVFIETPARELGAPPAGKASAGRMNAAGVAVFYGALDSETCIAEMRPALGGRVLVGGFRTTQTLRVLDFRRLQAARLAEVSYFDTRYSEQRERAVFLQRLHGLISRPVVPGHEDEYLITQTLSEYLAHVHLPKFDGVIFQSVQREGGANIVLFSREAVEAIADQPLGRQPKQPPSFPVGYVEGSAKLFVTNSIEYSHKQLHFFADNDWVIVHDNEDDFEDGDWE